MLFSRNATVVTCVFVNSLIAAGEWTAAQQTKIDVLRIGASPGLNLHSKEHQKDKGALDNLQSFIKEETGFDNQILEQKSWLDVAQKLAKGELHLGAFQGFEFA